MEWAGTKVCHRTMGEGSVTKNDGQYVYVQFENAAEEKMFAYPGCFRGFLTVKDPATMEEIEKALQEEDAKVEKAQFERLNRLNLLRQEVGKEKSAVRKAAKKTTAK